MGKGRTPCCDKSKVKRGPWSPQEDLTLITFIQKHGHHNWRSLPKLAGLMRCGKSCRLRWINYLRPDVKRGNFTKHEEDAIIHYHQTFGNKWSKIASFLPGRTDNEIKNVWNTHLKKRITTTHPSSSSSSSISSAHHPRTKAHPDNNSDGVQQEAHSSGVSIESQDSVTSSHPQAQCMHTKPELHDFVNEFHEIQLLLHHNDDFNDITSDFLQTKEMLFPLDSFLHHDQTHISTLCGVTHQDVTNSQSFDHPHPDIHCGESDLWKQLLESTSSPTPTHNSEDYNEWFNFFDNQTYFDDFHFVGEVCECL